MRKLNGSIVVFILGLALLQQPPLVSSARSNQHGCRAADDLVQRAVERGSKGDADGAFKLLVEAVDGCPNHAVALGHLGYMFAIGGNMSSAKLFLQRSLTFDSSLMQAWINLGNVMKSEQEHLDETEGDWKTVWRMYRTAYRLSPRQVDITANMAGLYAMERSWEQAAWMSTQSMQIEFTEEAFCAMMKALDNICLWNHPLRDDKLLVKLLFERATASLLSPERSTKDKLCFNAGTAALVADLPPDLVLLIARAEMAIEHKKIVPMPSALHSFQLLRGKRLVVSYVSGHFANHPMMQMMQGMFVGHTKEKIEVKCFATTKSDGSSLRMLAERGCQTFVDVSSDDDERVAGKINRAGTHILVNLFGFLEKARNAIAAYRAAPVQINHRWCSTTGSPHIDFHVSDKITSPPDYRGFYSEFLAYMPNSYLVNSHRLAYANQKLSSASVKQDKTSKEAVVFASLNNLYKLDERLFATWMQVMRKIPSSMLVLLQGREGMRANARLAQYAERFGISKDRMITALPVKKEEHIARHSQFTLFLDTWKVSSHSTAVDSLWAGLPVVVLPHEKMQARVSAALLYVLGMVEFLARDVGDYMDIIQTFCANTTKQRVARDRLVRLLDQSPLFDTQTWIKDAERMHRMMWDVATRRRSDESARASKPFHLIVTARG
mmetsp:Transcript_52362/g.162540  ORF Transcript_52362/g.162540 Transcript_52362/m.162540 type:complete len:665 (+) Transcript_52362:203-2197(+)